MCYVKSVPEQNHNLISYIATTVETMRDQMATRDDLVHMATRIETLREQMATKEDLVELVTRIETLGEQMATKEDLVRVEERMATKTEVAAIRGDIEQVQIRLDSIDRAQSARVGLIETELSRVRSVLYFLVKDRPDMLRLLGNTPTLGESRP